MQFGSSKVVAWLAASAALLVALAVGVAPADAASEQADTAQERRERVLAYWTPERVRNAIPRLPVVDGIPAHHRPDHAGGPGGGDDGDGDSGGDVTGAPWNDTSEKGMVGETTGKVLLTMDGTDYVCSGSTVASPAGDSVVLTAGHCVHDGDNEERSWATNWMFIPAYEDGGSFSSCADTTYGCWTAEILTTTTAWYKTGDFADDAGFANMAPGGKQESSALNVVDEIGSQAITFDHAVAAATIYAFGYPAAQKYNGRDLIYCAGSAVDGVIAGTAGLDCDMTGGSSGGPWYASFDETSATGTAVSVNSHIFRSIKDRMFGPVFDSDEQAAYELAYNDGTGSGAQSSP
ncbi:MAG: hypothetical protein M3N28_04645 [Actinomycetota bacterium]|nr:hypothetical protein [Actinomycetota bacterium]